MSLPRTTSEKVSDRDASSLHVDEESLEDDTDVFPPQDKGAGAWIFLLGASVIEAVTWGFPACFGVFREYYFTHAPFEGISSLAVVGVMSN
ncbi:hypothetical protein HKX48_008516, partial [Thoreauomyces humboldtii]